MAPVPPQRLKTPILLGVKQARALVDLLQPLGFNVRAFFDKVGVASAVKMCRSVMIKGLEVSMVSVSPTIRGRRFSNRGCDLRLLW
jgi:hypothetical protein